MAEIDNVELQALKEENKLLALQLEQVQEELEHYSLKAKEQRRRGLASSNLGTSPSWRLPRSSASLPHALISRVRQAKKIECTTKSLDCLVKESPKFKRLEIASAQANRTIAKLKDRLERMRVEKSALEEQIKCCEKAANASNDEIRVLRSRISDLEIVQAELEAARRELSAQADSRARVYEQAKAEWDCERRALETTKEEAVRNLKSKIDDVELEREELRAALRDLDEKLKTRSLALEEERTAWNKRQKSLEAQVESAREQLAARSQQIDNLNRQIEASERAIESVRSDLSLAVRLQTLRENDLKELQSRYGDLLEKKEKQDDLLGKLDERLSVAHDCLKQLDLQAGGEDGFDQDMAKKLIKSLSQGPAS